MREKLSLDFGWRFHKGEVERFEPLNHNFVYYKTKAECGRDAADPAFYDMNWEIVDLPHDYAIDNPIDKTVPAAHGFIPRQNGWYRRIFRLNEADRGRRIVLMFDGIVTHAKIWVNGHLMHRNFCGYTSFSVDITEVVNTDDRLNLLSVYVETDTYEGWWYEGAGIYRHVWMLKTNPVCVDEWGTYITSAREGGVWRNHIETTLRNDSYDARTVTLISRLTDGAGRLLAETESEAAISHRERLVVVQEVQVDNPPLWDIEQPQRCTLTSIIMEGDTELDRYETRYGYRTLRFDCNEGFFLNDRPVKLKGVCCHEDHANLGVAVPDEIRRERMTILKRIGVNAYRCAHNPPTPEVLDLCDELGILVMDENRWFDASPQGLEHLRSMIVRDRNHPCIILWSMANEEPLQACERGRKIMASMRAYAKKLDATRPIMLAMHTGLFDKAVSHESDVIGINYNEEMYDQIHAAYPNTPMVISEIGGLIDEMSIMRDGSGYDWSLADTRPFVMGIFKWAGFVYRGETRGWPKLYSRSGIIDPTGEPKENTYFYKSMWSNEDFAAIWPRHWNWPELEGDDREVRVYTTGDEIALYLNGEKVGEQKVQPYVRPTFQVPYHAGRLEAVALRSGQEIARDVIETTGSPNALTLRATLKAIDADKKSVFTVWVSAKDAQDRDVRWAADEVSFAIEGDVKVLASGNTDQYDDRAPKSMVRRMYNGSCYLILRAGTQPGILKIRVSSPGLASAEISVEQRPCMRAPHVAEILDVDSLTYFAKMEG